jgi:hypothetical protein
MARRARGSTGKIAWGSAAKAALAEHTRAPLRTLRRVSGFMGEPPV